MIAGTQSETLLDEMVETHAVAIGLYPSRDIAQSLLDDGLTPEDLTLIGVCTQHAVEHRTALAFRTTWADRDLAAGKDVAVTSRTAARLLEDVRAWKHEAGFLRSVRTWVPIIAAVPQDRRLGPLLASQPKDRTRPSPRQQWIRWVGWERGPLAYLAGLRLAEARRSSSASRLDADALRVLAALRGAVLPEGL